MNKSKRLKRKKLPYRQRIERIYDRLFRWADAIIKKDRPCEVRLVRGKAVCLDCRKRADCLPAKPNVLCCPGCQWRSDTGCTANKPLTCKVWLCRSAWMAHPTTHKKLERIRNWMWRFNFWVERGDKRMSIQQFFAFGGKMRRLDY